MDILLTVSSTIGVVYSEFLPEAATVNKEYYLNEIRPLKRQTFDGPRPNFYTNILILSDIILVVRCRGQHEIQRSNKLL